MSRQLPTGEVVQVVVALNGDGTGIAGGGGGGGTASDTNQVLQITEAQTTNTRVGTLTETAPGTDTASSGLNGRLQRIAQRITSLIALLPTALGRSSAAASFPIALSNEDFQDLYVVGEAGRTATVNNILTTTAGAAASDLTGYRSGSVQVVSTGAAGTFIFEGSNDNINFVPMAVWNTQSVNGTTIAAAITATASQLIYTFPIKTRYIRLRIATTITGGLSCFSRFSQASFSPVAYQVANNTASNLNVNATVAGSLTTLTTVTTVGTLTGGGVAEDAVTSASPVMTGGVVRNAIAAATITGGDACRNTLTNGGALVTKLYSVPETDWQYATPIGTPIVNTTAVPIRAALASYRNYVTGVQIHNSTAVASIVTIQDGATVIWTHFVPASMTVPINVEFATPLRGSVNTAMNFVVNTTATSTIVSAQGYQAL